MSDQHNITISGNTVSTGLNDSSNQPIGIIQQRYVYANGHKLSLSESSVECVKCDESCDVPSLVRESSPFVHVLYKLFAVGKVSNNFCTAAQESAQTFTETVINNGNITPSSSSVSDVAQYMYKHSTQSQ